MYICENFELQELVCPEVYNKYGMQAWSFFDPRILTTMDLLRQKLNRSIIINTWHAGGDQTQSGLRCNLCSIAKDQTDKGALYLSAHCRGMAFDFHAEGMLPEETRLWIAANKIILPYPIRLERAVNWVHIDCASESTEKITFFNS